MGNYVKILVVENKFEADLVSQALKEEGIPVMVRKFSDTAYDSLYIPQKGWASIMIPEECKPHGERVVAEFEEVFKKRRGEDDKLRK